ncbi:carboxylesterase family protein [Catenuloplanes japonicus]|uniref:carboxylesterase family protein n=1 Tax=Catenuloplanes japonicus TaxID=33876 RepID=UPI0006892BD4|nr:carboxylesterase family protein [Catenuloplanes japonicus]
MTDSVVRTDSGAVRGLSGVWKGIPFAAPPRGDLRFAAPARPEPWDGVRDALEFGPAVPQPSPAPGVPTWFDPDRGDDWLTLNVWSPDHGRDPRLPVMVWLHGGGWKIGWPGMPQYDGAMLAGHGVVVVTVAYRLGHEGFGDVPGAPPNRGLRDQLAALEWVHRNIAKFGGDPDKVTVFGQSAGAASAALLGAYPGTKGLIRRVIAQSIPDGYATGPTPEPMPRIDGDLVPAPPWELSLHADLMAGFNHQEWRTMGPPPPGDHPELAHFKTLYPKNPEIELMSELLFRRPTTRIIEQNGGHLYDFAWRDGGHGVELPFVFGNHGNRFADRYLGNPPPPEFAPLSRAMRTAWTDFARTGDPGWPRYDKRSAGPVRRWDTEPADVRHPYLSA